MKHPILLLFLFIFLVSCSQKTYQTVYPTLSDGKYDSEFPYKNCSKQLDRISQSIKKISSIVFYDVYEIDAETKVGRNEINTDILQNYAKRLKISTDHAVGTAIIIHKTINQIAVLTCAHVVDGQDSIFYLRPNQKDVNIVAIKKKQSIYIPDLLLNKKFEILAIDKTKDIALLGFTGDENLKTDVEAFPYPPGKSEEIEWGTFVYIMGYPIGLQMITKGIVSSPDRKKKDTFLIDAVFNHGFSGGPVLAIRDGVPNFELLGMVKSSYAEHENILVPHFTSRSNSLNKGMPYTGDIYIKSSEKINYGVTFSIKMESIISFYKKNQKQIQEKGYFLNHFFEK